MKKILLIFTALLLIGCSRDKSKVEFDKNQNTITVVSSDYSISTILINELKDGEQLDSTYTGITFIEPQVKVDLNNIKNAELSGRPIQELLAKKNLIYKIMLKPTKENAKVTLIYFETKAITNPKQIFTSI